MPSATQTIFIADGDNDNARNLARQIETIGFVTRTFDDAVPALRAAEAEPPSLFLLGQSLREGSGVELCRRLRQLPQLAKTPIIFVARGSESERIVGLEAGADDYLAPPFSPRELVARVKAVLRRYEPAKTEQVLHVGPLAIDRLAMTVSVGEQDVPLTVTEFRLLEHLARNPGRVLSREQLLAVLWRGPGSATPRAIDVYIRRVRAKIEHDPENPVYLTTVRGTGYRLNAPNAAEIQDLGA